MARSDELGVRGWYLPLASLLWAVAGGCGPGFEPPFAGSASEAPQDADGTELADTPNAKGEGGDKQQVPIEQQPETSPSTGDAAGATPGVGAVDTDPTFDDSEDDADDETSFDSGQAEAEDIAIDRDAEERGDEDAGVPDDADVPSE